LQIYVEAIDRNVALPAPCDQNRAAICRHQSQDRIDGVGGILILEINPRDRLLCHAAREDRQENMRRAAFRRVPGSEPGLMVWNKKSTIDVRASAAKTLERAVRNGT
jgi:hypothetical protein